MKRKKGFTLIELLAIIVILAIIAVITVPIILDIIEDSKGKAAVDSAYGFKDAVEKYYMTANMSNSEIKMNGKYSINNGIIEGPSIESTEITVSGTKPSLGYLTYNNNKIQDACLIIDEYQIIYSDGKFTNEGKNDYCEIDADLEHNSWATIKANLKRNRNVYDEQIGMEKEIEIDGISYTVRLANTSPCPEGWTGSETACGVVIEFVDTIIDTDNNNAEGHIMNSSNTNAGGWPASEMYSYINTTIFNKLPNELKTDGMIINTKSLSGYGSGSANFESSDKLYLLSYVELFGTNYGNDTLKLATDQSPKGTRQLDYYKKTGTNKIKSTVGGTATVWWLRSAFAGYSNWYIAIGTNGNAGGNGVLSASGVAPAFRIME